MWATSWYRVNRSPCLFPLSSVKAIFCVPRNALEPDCQRRCGKSSAETVFPGVSDLSSLHQGFLNVPSSVSCPLCRRWCHNLWWTSQALDPFSGSMWNPQLHQSPSWLLSSCPVHHTPPPWTGNDKDTQPTPSWPLSWDRVPRLWWFTTNTTCRSNLAHTITFYSLTVSGFFLWWGWGGVVFFLISCQVYLLACSLWQGGASLTTCLSHLVFANGDALIQQLSPEGLSNMFRSLAYSLAYSWDAGPQHRPWALLSCSLSKPRPVS